MIAASIRMADTLLPLRLRGFEQPDLIAQMLAVARDQTRSVVRHVEGKVRSVELQRVDHPRRASSQRHDGDLFVAFGRHRLKSNLFPIRPPDRPASDPHVWNRIAVPSGV